MCESTCFYCWKALGEKLRVNVRVYAVCLWYVLYVTFGIGVYVCYVLSCVCVTVSHCRRRCRVFFWLIINRSTESREAKPVYVRYTDRFKYGFSVWSVCVW